MLEKLFNYDNPVISFLNFIGKLIILNVLWIISSIPIITLGASTTALYKVLFKIIDHKDNFPFKLFFVTLKKEFKNATLLWTGLLIWVSVFAFDTWFGISSGYEFSSFFIVLGVMGVIMGIFIFFIAFPYISLYNNTLRNYIINTCKIICCCPVRVILISLMWILAIGINFTDPNVFIHFGFVWPLCGFATLFYFTAFIVKSIFKSIVKKSKELN